MNTKKRILSQIDKVRSTLSKYFIADGTDNVEVRRKHKRVGIALILIIVSLLVAAIFLSSAVDSGVFDKRELKKTSQAPSTKVDIKNLSNGVTHEKTWLEKAEQELLDLRLQQKFVQENQLKLDEYLNKESITKKELAEILKDFEKKLHDQYESRLLEQQSTNSSVNVQQPAVNPIEITQNKSKIKIKKIGAYIPAGSYVEAKMISGVDAGIGISAEADPRQVLLRIVGKVISAGFGKDYLTTGVLMGCIVQCQAIGDLSSEKAYLKPVVMTCAKSPSTVIEVPVKGYVTSSGKVGIRGEIISREGDLVTKSFLSGLVGGIGSGVNQVYEPNYAISSGFAVKQKGQDAAKSILGSGLGRGINESSNRLSDYLIKRAEQYQPVISINEGVGVDLVFQEGFSLNEEDYGK